MDSKENLTPRELLYLAYQELHRKALEKEGEQQKGQPDVSLKEEQGDPERPLSLLIKAYTEKKKVAGD